MQKAMHMKVKYTILSAALAASLFGVPAFAASTAISNSGSTASGTGTGIGIGGGNATSNTTSGAISGSTSVGGIGTGGTGGNGSGSSVVNFTYNDPAGPGAGGDPVSTENLVTSGTQRVVTVGTAIAPSFYSNNACGLAASAAAGFMGGGFSLGFDRIDKGCDARAFAALLGHFAEINSIAATHATDPQTRALAAQNAIVYSQWANNYLCAANPDLAAAVPPGSNVCHVVATQSGLQVVPAPAPISYTASAPVAAVPSQPVVAIADPPPKPPVPHVYGTREGVPTSYRTGPISGYNGPEYSDD